MSFTGNFWWTNTETNEIANNKICLRAGTYWTAVKGEPFTPAKPDQCWACTNRFDPKAREEDANTRP